MTSQCSKLSPYFSPIHNGQFIIMFSHLSGMGSFPQGNLSMLRHHYVTSVNMKKFMFVVIPATRLSHVWILQVTDCL